MRVVGLIALLTVFILGAWFRIEGVINGSFAFTYDVGRDLLAVGDIVHLGKIPLIGQTTGLPGLFYGPWWYYILTPPFIMSSGNPVGMALFMGLIGITTFFLGFRLGKSIGGVVLGIIFTSFMALFPTMIAVSSQIWNPNLIPLFIILFMYCLHSFFSSLREKQVVSGLHLLLFGILLGLILDSEVVFGLLFLVGVVASMIILLRKRFQLKNYLLIALGFLIILSPRIAFDLRHNFLMTNTLLVFIKKTLFSHGSGASFMPFNSLRALYGLWVDTVSMGNVFLGFALLVLAILGLILIYKKLKMEEKFFLLINSIILLIFLVGLSFFPGDIWGHYIVGLPVLYLFILSIVVSGVWQNFKRIKFFVIAAVIACLIWPVLSAGRYKNSLPVGDASYYRNQLAVVDYVYKQVNGQEFNYVLYTPPVHDYTYRYLFSWYGKKQYGYVPKTEKASLFFLIIEPDYQYPFRLTNWLEVRKDDGKIIKQEKEKSGIIIQTRIH